MIKISEDYHIAVNYESYSKEPHGFSLICSSCVVGDSRYTGGAYYWAVSCQIVRGRCNTCHTRPSEDVLNKFRFIVESLRR